VILCVVIAVPVSAQQSTSRVIDPVDPKTIYGSDDRKEFYEASTAAESALFDATAALFWDPDGFLIPTGDGYAIDTSYTLSDFVSEAYGAPLCAWEPYRDQPSPAFCSGFMVGDDLVVTAGHCVSNSRDCDNTTFVFGFHMDDAVTPVNQVAADDVYVCSEIVARVENSEEDWSLIRVDRPIVGHSALPVRRTGAVEADAAVSELAVCGHPVGIPAKFVDNGWVQGTAESYFQANVDAYTGNSGSVVVSLNQDGELHLVEGVLVRGNIDFVVAAGAGCYESYQCPDSGCGSSGALEEITRVTRFADYLPTEPHCGDGVCNADEDCATCPDDCGPCPFCGDGTCDPDEDYLSCPIDCEPPFFCGDGICSGDEDCVSCSIDCGPCTSRQPVQGDIFHRLAGDAVLMLGGRSELVWVDISEPAIPQIIGRLHMTGTPVELYAIEDFAIVLENNWVGYYGTRATAVDFSDPTHMRVADRVSIPGQFRTSRLVSDGAQSSLYVVTGGYQEWENEDGTTTWESRTYVSSFDVSDGSLQPQSELDLGGYFADVHATEELLLVARNNWRGDEPASRIAVVDIRDPGGVMEMGDQVSVTGWIRNQFNMDLYNEVLRVVAGGRWSGTRTNHLQTFDASDFGGLQEIDTESFGHGENLYATLFVGNHLFASTADEDDPFHAFYIDDNGYASEMSEFIVSGWNDFFTPAFSDDRLIGVGVAKDEGGTTPAVSLYDISDVGSDVLRTNGLHPLIFQVAVGTPYSWSEASWDHRAFSVLEDAVDVEEPGGVTETGLVLLPFSGWDEGREGYVSGAQIFTFSENTLTVRGSMDHGTPVRRSFLAEDDVAGNLSEAGLSLYDISDPDAPIELGGVELRVPKPEGVDIVALCSGEVCEPVRPNDKRATIGFYGPSMIVLESDLFSEFIEVTMEYRERGRVTHDITELCAITQRMVGGKYQIEVHVNPTGLPAPPDTWAYYEISLHPMPVVPNGAKLEDGIWIRTDGDVRD
jgi:hypothetical protein